jgi:hypothetical protein
MTKEQSLCKSSSLSTSGKNKFLMPRYSSRREIVTRRGGSIR